MGSKKTLTQQRRAQERARSGAKPGSPGGAKRPPGRRPPTRSAWSRRAPWIGAGAVVAVVVVFVAVSLGGGGSPAKQAGSSPTGSASTAANVPASSAVVRDVTNVPASTFDTVGVGTAAGAPSKLPASTPALTSGGKPRIFYLGAEYCPYCAAQRWPLIVALSRFGTFSGLGASESSTSDVYPATQTFTFHGSTYDSPYLVFTPVETETNQPTAGGYEPLERPTAEEQQLIATYDAPPYVSHAGAIPFLDIAGRYVLNGAQFDPQVLQGLSRQEIAAALSDPTSAVAKAVNGSANVLTAQICQATGGKPGSVCTSPGVQAAAAALGSAG